MLDQPSGRFRQPHPEQYARQPDERADGEQDPPADIEVRYQGEGHERRDGLANDADHEHRHRDTASLRGRRELPHIRRCQVEGRADAYTGQETPERQRDNPGRECGAEGPQAGDEQRGKERELATPPVRERPDEVRPHDVADQPDGYRHELHVVGGQGELLGDSRHPEADVGDVIEDEEVRQPQHEKVEAGQRPPRQLVHTVQQRLAPSRSASVFFRPGGYPAHRGTRAVARCRMTPTGTVNRRARTGTAPSGRTDKADGPERTVHHRISALARTLCTCTAGKHLHCGNACRDSRPQRRALKEPLVPAGRVLGPVSQ